MLWVHRLNVLHSDPDICPMFPGPVYVVGSWAGWPTFWPWYLPNVSRTSVCCGFLGMIAYILSQVSTQCFQHQCMLWIPGLDVLHSDPGIYPMFPVPVYVVDSWAGWPTFWPWYLPNVSRTSVCCGFLGLMTYILILVSAQCFQDQCMLWIPRHDCLHFDPGICPMFPGTVYVVDAWAGCPTFLPKNLHNVSRTSVCCGFLGWMTYILTLVSTQCFQDQCMLWVPGLDDLHSDPGIYPMFPGPVYVVDAWAGCPTFCPKNLHNVSRTSVCCGFLGWMTYILTLVSAQCFQDQCMLWIPGLDILHFDPGICPMFPGPVYVVDCWAWLPTFWPWYLPNVSRTSVCGGFLSMIAYILTLVSAQCFQDQCMLWIPGLDGLHSDPGVRAPLGHRAALPHHRALLVTRPSCCPDLLRPCCGRGSPSVWYVYWQQVFNCLNDNILSEMFTLGF